MIFSEEYKNNVKTFIKEKTLPNGFLINAHHIKIKEKYLDMHNYIISLHGDYKTNLYSILYDIEIPTCLNSKCNNKLIVKKFHLGFDNKYCCQKCYLEHRLEKKIILEELNKQKSLDKLSNLYPRFNYDIHQIGDGHNNFIYKINNYCKHGDLILQKSKFNKLYNHNSDYYCDKCKEEALENISFFIDEEKINVYRNELKELVKNKNILQLIRLNYFEDYLIEYKTNIYNCLMDYTFINHDSHLEFKEKLHKFINEIKDYKSCNLCHTEKHPLYLFKSHEFGCKHCHNLKIIKNVTTPSNKEIVELTNYLFPNGLDKPARYFQHRILRNKFGNIYFYIKNKYDKVEMKTALYMYLNNINEYVKCKNPGCNNILEATTLLDGFNSYCCDKCAYEYKNKLHVDEIINNTILEDDKIIKYRNYLIDNDITNKNLIYKDENLYKYVIKFTENYKDADWSEKVYMFTKNIKERPKCEKCGSDTHYVFFVRKSYVCNNKECVNNSSEGERELHNYISGLVGKENIEKIWIKEDIKRELDIYVKNLNIAFEYNGVYWHNEDHKYESYHYEKYKLAKSKGIKMITVWEDDWYCKQDIVKSIVKNQLGKNENRIYARKCKIKEIHDNKITQNFLNKNHIQGNCNSSIKIGLYYNNELVSIMAFGKKRFGGKKKKTPAQKKYYEIYRFCSKLNTSVIGGASKLFKFFINKYDPLRVYSFANMDMSDGNIYKILNFTYNSYSPEYWWCKTTRENRQKYTKENLVKQGYSKNKTEKEIMISRGYNKINGVGNTLYVWKKINNKIYEL